MRLRQHSSLRLKQGRTQIGWAAARESYHCKLAVMLLQAENPKTVRKEGREVIRCLLEGIRS